MRRRRQAHGALAAIMLSALAAPGAIARNTDDTPVAAERGDDVDRGARRLDGFVPVRIEANGSVRLELPPAGENGVMLRAIHATGLTAGLGSNPVGLARGAFEGGRIVAFRRIGDAIVLEAENWRYRASADQPLEKRAVAESFAQSFLWSADVFEDLPNGGALVDISPFLESDAFGVAAALKSAGEGDFELDPKRSFALPGAALAFPDNVEFDAALTFAANTPGPETRAAAADARAVTLVQHHSFVRLPDDGYRPRAFDPRVGAIEVPYYDFSAPLDAPLRKGLARRFRLERADASASRGPVMKPLVFYVDPGAPKRVRDALVDGTRWWADAFDAAGFENAFEVRLLPEDAHPFDVRYNVIQWTHRQTRGWSYGGGVHDPRTGEMLKAHVILGSQRVRQDRMIFEGLAGAGKSGSGAPDDPVEIALARIRQLAAHEVGHTLGFAHNFAASGDDRASVMDYPAPLVTPTADGGLDFSQAYGVGVGAWDAFAVKWLYSEFAPNTDENRALAAIVAEADAAGLRFVDDANARDVGSAHPAGSLWDNGADPVASLETTLRVRDVALSNFGRRSLRKGRPASDLTAVLPPIYLYHRYQTQAAAKLVGGYRFRHAVVGDGREANTPVTPANQRRALAALLQTIDPQALDLPNDVLDLLSPSIAEGELFAGETGAMFDLASAADAAASLTLSALLHPARAARLVETHRRDPNALSLEEALGAIDASVFAEASSPRLDEIARVVRARFVSTLIDLASGALPAGEAQAAYVGAPGGAGDAAATPVRVRVDAYLNALRSRLSDGAASDAHKAWLAKRSARHLDRHAPDAPPTIAPRSAPPGSPIGARETCWHCEPL
ncbi:MAG: zinc-dependent metalloprotease [Parvularculaceae bacterium]